jgi:hypothetical protein
VFFSRLFVGFAGFFRVLSARLGTAQRLAAFVFPKLAREIALRVAAFCSVRRKSNRAICPTYSYKKQRFL